MKMEVKRYGMRWKIVLVFMVIGALRAKGASGSRLLLDESVVTYDNFITGTEANPLVLRTYFPDPGLSGEVLVNHAIGYRSRRYKMGEGDVEGFADPIRGIVAGIGVNFGGKLSYCWDTTECRLLFAWQGGFMDMTNDWGNPNDGRRGSYNNVPKIEGNLIYLTKGSHPLMILDEFTNTHSPKYHSMRLVGNVPEFAYKLGKAMVRVRITPGENPMTLVKSYFVTGVDRAEYHETDYDFSLVRKNSLEFSVKIEGRKDLVRADDAYLSESIRVPGGKIVEGFPSGFMPVYSLEDDQAESLVRFLKEEASQ